MRPAPKIPEGFPELPKPMAYVWPEDVDDCVFYSSYTPSAPKPDGTYSMAIFTEQQMIEYAATVAATYAAKITAAIATTMDVTWK